MEGQPQETATVLDNRVWRVEHEQANILRRLDKIEEKLDRISQGHDERWWKMNNFEERMDKIDKKSSAFSLLGDSAIVRTIFYGLLAAVVALATGNFLNLVGMLK